MSSGARFHFASTSSGITPQSSVSLKLGAPYGARGNVRSVPIADITSIMVTICRAVWSIAAAVNRMIVHALPLITTNDGAASQGATVDYDIVSDRGKEFAGNLKVRK